MAGSIEEVDRRDADRPLRNRLALALAAALGLAWSAPPAVVPGGEWLVLLGLGSFYALVRGGRVRGDRWLVLAVGAVHMAWFSWSVHHVAWVGYGAIVGLGALYYLLAAMCARALACWMPGPLAFGLAMAASCQARAWMPGIHYPHGQFAHALYQWPSVLGIVGWVGEAGANLVVAGLSAAVVDSAMRRQGHRSVGALLGFTGVIVFAAAVTAPCGPSPARDPGREPAVDELTVVAMEPGVPVLSVVNASTIQRDREVMERLALPSRRIAPWRARPGTDGEPPPDLIVWPESSAPLQLRVEGSEERVLPLYPGARWRPFPLAESTSLLVAGLLEREQRLTPCCALFSHRAKLLGVYEKRRLVPGGEFLPGLAWLPAWLADRVQEFVHSKMGEIPNFVPGRPRVPIPLPVQRGERVEEVPIGALLCYDNAFPAVARGHVAAGARLLVVASNEAWYRRGNEFEQMAAMTVFRALETATPVVRSTIDGPTLAVAADGQMVGVLPWDDPPAASLADVPDSRWLRVSLRLGPGVERPLAWLHSLCSQLVVASVAFAIAARWRFRDRL